MKLKRYAPSTSSSLEGMLAYLKSIINPFLKEIADVTSSLDFTDNFRSEKFELKQIKRLAGAYRGITVNHNLGSEPRYFLIMNGVAGVIKGVPWNKEQVTFFLDPTVYSVGVERDATIIIFK